MGYFPGIDGRRMTKAERAAHAAACAIAARRQLAWYAHYRTLGLGHFRALEHAGRQASKGRTAPSTPRA